MNIYGGGPPIIREKPYIYGPIVILQEESLYRSMTPPALKPSISKGSKRASEEVPKKRTTKTQITQKNLEKLPSLSKKSDVIIHAISAMDLTSPTSAAQEQPKNIFARRVHKGNDNTEHLQPEEERK